ncbi:MAG: NAD(+) synthase, partial [Muribaculaceae bacterium]|nr:NAD(+) synthase [Muribaculaceae bacterium]
MTDNNIHAGYFRVAAVSPKLKVADCDYNTLQIVTAAKEAAAQGARLIVFPELALTAYTCGDLFHNTTLLEAAQKAFERIVSASLSIPAAMVIGVPKVIDGTLYNTAFIVANGEVAGPWTKTYIPNYNEFYEKRWWPQGDTTPLLAEIDGVKVGVEICEDLWAPIPPSCRASLAGADIVVNLSASDDVIGKYDYLTSLIANQSARNIGGYVYAGAGWGESSTDLVYDGKCIIAENGNILAVNDRWQWDTQMVLADIDIMALRRDRMHITTFSDCARREVDHPYSVISLPLPTEQPIGNILHPIARTPFVPSTDEHIDQRCSEIINIQCSGLAKRLTVTNCKSLTIGISGGLDSTLALLVAVYTFDKLALDRKGIIGVTMPGFGTTDRTYTNALTLMQSLGITIREVPIADAVNLHFRDIGHDPSVQDVTYENSQARERTQILMDIANQTGGMVLGTGDLSELALGWATYNGDHMSMYGVNAGVPKTLVRY